MGPTAELRCDCGTVRLEVSDVPILTAACYCTSCRDADARWASLPTPGPVLESDSGTEFVLYRKDRVRCLQGDEALTAFRLAPDSHTRRVYAKCCNTPMFLEFDLGHWVSLYARLWPEARRPRPQMRTMTGDLPEGTTLSSDLASPRAHSVAFYARLLAAWVMMGFLSPKLSFVREEDR